jgi:hypothetical protein
MTLRAEILQDLHDVLGIFLAELTTVDHEAGLTARKIVLQMKSAIRFRAKELASF